MNNEEDTLEKWGKACKDVERICDSTTYEKLDLDIGMIEDKISLGVEEYYKGEDGNKLSLEDQLKLLKDFKETKKVVDDMREERKKHEEELEEFIRLHKISKKGVNNNDNEKPNSYPFKETKDK